MERFSILFLWYFEICMELFLFIIFDCVLVWFCFVIVFSRVCNFIWSNWFWWMRSTYEDINFGRIPKFRLFNVVSVFFFEFLSCDQRDSIICVILKFACNCFCLFLIDCVLLWFCFVIVFSRVCNFVCWTSFSASRCTSRKRRAIEVLLNFQSNSIHISGTRSGICRMVCNLIWYSLYSRSTISGYS